MRLRRCRLPVVVWVVGWLVALLAPSPGEAAHPFYERLLRDGVAARQVGDVDGAARTLELAAFGFLEEPPLLARSLTHLCLAYLDLGDSDDELRRALERLVEVEDRFGGYRAAEISDPVRTELAARLLASARSDVDRDRLGAARRRVETLLTLEPDAADARCLRGRLVALDGDCPAAGPDLEACTRPPTELRTARSRLACHLELAEWDRARTLVAQLPRDLRRDRSMAELLERLDNAPATSVAPTDPTVPERPMQLPAEPVPETPTAAERRRMAERARELLDDARTVSDLTEALQLAGRVADLTPDDVEAQLLAGEVAYRASRWEDAVHYFERAGALDAARPEILFFLAVALYETDRQERARTTLEKALPNLARTAFVNRYVDKILSPDM